MKIEYSEPPEYSFILPNFIDIVKNDNITTVFDVGCNVGAFVKLINRKINTVRKIIGFEPDIENYNFLLSCNYPNFVIHNKGIFYGATESSVLGVGDNSIGGYMVGNIESQHIKRWDGSIVTYNKIFKLDILENYIENEQLDLLKMDVEASEYNIIENSSAIKKFKWLIIEFHNHDTQYYNDFILQKLPMFKVISVSDRQYLLKNL